MIIIAKLPLKSLILWQRVESHRHWFVCRGCSKLSGGAAAVPGGVSSEFRQGREIIARVGAVAPRANIRYF